MNSGREQTWGQLLGGLVYAMSLEELVRIDLSALRAAGIEANSPPNKATSSATDAQQQARQLASHGLALVFGPSQIIVTTSDRVAHWREDLQPTSAPRVYYVQSEHLLFELSSSALPVGQDSTGKHRSKGQLEPQSSQAPRWEQGGTEIVSVARWRSLPAPERLAWDYLLPSSISDVGHRACTIEFVDQSPTVVVRRAYVQQAYWYVVWLATVVGGTWWLARRADRLLLLLALAATACMVASPHWLTLPQVVLVGLLSAAALRIVNTYVAKGTHDQSTQAIMARTARLILLASMCTLANETLGAPTPDETPDVGRDLPRVLVPIDDDGKLHGEDVYLPELFLTALKNSLHKEGHDDSRYVLLSAKIRGSLPSAARQRSRLADPWRASFKLECFQPSCQIELPLRQADGTWIDQLCKLDGKTVPIRWLPGGQGCQIDVLGLGVHQLELSLRPNFDASAQRSRLQLHIPRLSGVQLELAVASATENLHIADSGEIHPDSDTNIWRTTLAPTDALRIDWTTAGRQPIRDLASDIEQFCWLRVEQSVARLEVQLLIRGAAAAARQFQLQIDPQLKLLPPEEHSPIEKAVSQPGDPGTVRLLLKSGLGPNTRIPLNFQLQRTASLGRFYFPRVRIQGVTPSRSLFAASVGVGLSYQEEAGDTMRSISSSEFSSEWGDASSSPLFAYSLDHDDPEWSLRVWPDPEAFAAQQSMQLHCRSHEVELEYSAAVSQVVGKCLIHRLQTSPELEIDEITVLEQPAGDALPIRWEPAQPIAGDRLSRPTHQSPTRVGSAGKNPSGTGRRRGGASDCAAGGRAKRNPRRSLPRSESARGLG